MPKKRHKPEGDCHEAPASRCPGLTGPGHCRCNPPDRRERGRLRDELLNGEIFYLLREAQIVVESWRHHYNAVRPHASLGYGPSIAQCLTISQARMPRADRARGNELSAG